MKHVKSKRTFTNTFSKSKLVEMGLKQSVEKVTNLLRDSKAAMSADTKQDLSFLIGFGDAENDKSVQFNQLSKEYAYSKGCALYVLVSIENSYYSAEYTFKLLEQGYVLYFFSQLTHANLCDVQNAMKLILSVILLLICRKKLTN